MNRKSVLIGVGLLGAYLLWRRAKGARMSDTPAPSIEDLIQNENLVTKSLDQLSSDWAAWKSEVYGLIAVWDKIRGGADIKPFQDRLATIKKQIDTTPFTPEGKTRVQTRYDQVAATIVPVTNWTPFLIAVGGVIGLKILGSATAAGTTWALGRAKAHAHGRLAKTRFGRKLGFKLEKKKKKKKRTRIREAEEVAYGS